MKLRTKIGLGIASFLVVSLPFLFRAKKQNEPVDIIGRDVYEHKINYLSREPKGVLRKTYFLPDGKEFNVYTIPKNLKKEPDDIPVWKTPGMYLEDKTPQTFNGYTITECRIFGDVYNKVALSSKDIDVIVEQAKIDTFYRNLENKIMCDVLSTGTETGSFSEPIFDSQTLEKFFDALRLDKLFSKPVFTAKRKVYLLEEGVEITVKVVAYNKNSRYVQSTAKDMPFLYVDYEVNLGNDISGSLCRYGERKPKKEEEAVKRCTGSISGQRLEQIVALIK